MTDITIFENKKIAFQTLGCKLNFAETSALGRQLSEIGFIKAKTNEEADVVIINTCSVTDTADKKGRQMIHRMIKKHPNAYIVVTGCYAQLKPEEIANIEGVDLVLGANEKVILPQFLENLAKKQHGEYHVVRTAQIRNFRPECSADDRTRHFLKVQDGCDYYCTYCTIPFARGRSRNASIAETIKVAQKAITDGAKEIVLTGVNTGDFGRSTGETFFELIQALDNLNGDIRYRISSIEPNLLTDEIIDFVANSQHFAPHFHIPLQSGSDTLLKLMHRRYDTALFAYKINRIKQIMPNAFIGVDVMVGVRGETPELFNECKTFIESLPISQLHVFTYSERAGTKALSIEPIVPINERRRRNEILQQVSDSKLNSFYQSQQGKDAIVLWEDSKKGDMMHGFTENYVKVETKYNKNLVNTFEKITIKTV
ncbi:MAG: tRNA (N(6)-L-threonylcarbamoyladenosine(37)-C(2))-methylthiotransferase MtaB [Paludibacteraceae bacterium]|jgi:threonylcarbamoyladenosine tRNA methylthiotransferase MtaB|nr:tRNA (N(6)-L-threonylcarbamoyladenosine(37)-C(2))-methylthiotransferase MtaB [Paludibacteraceae bacterium]